MALVAHDHRPDHRTRRVRFASLVATVCTLALGACRGLGDITAPTPVETPVAAVELSAEQVSLAEGGTTVLQAVARDVRAGLIANQPIFWSSSDTAVARVSGTGVVTAVRSGAAIIAASAGGRSATARVVVTTRAVASVQVTPTSPSLLVGGVLQLTARTFDDAGAPLSGRPVFWTTDAPGTAVVDANGRVSGIAPGLATITATSEARSAAVGVTVAPVPVALVSISPERDTVVLGQSRQFTATTRDSAGTVLTGRTVTWSTSDAALATVSSAGIALGSAPGSVSITATAEGRVGRATLVVLPRPVGAVLVSPAASSLVVGQSVQLTVQITDGTGNLLVGRPLAFGSSNDAVATVSGTGLVRATAPGTATLTVTSEGKTGTATVTVTPSPVASIRVTPGTVSLLVGQTARLTAAALDASGAVLPQRPITWSTGSPSIATVSADGTVTAVGAGTALVLATAEGRLGSTTITVTAPTAATLSVSPAQVSVIAGQSTDLVAAVRDPNGVAIAGRTISWSSSNPSIAVVSSTGRVRAVAPGTVRIDAAADGLNGSSQVTVTPVPVASVTVTLSAPAILAGFTTQASAVVRDSAGNILTGRAVTWTSSAPLIAVVSAQGLVSGVAVGSATIRATVEGVSGSAVVTVAIGAVSSFTATTALTQTAPVGSAVGVVPTVRVADAAGSGVPGVAVTFAVTAGGGSTVPASPATVLTNGFGFASVGSWTLGTTVGGNSLTATAVGFNGPPVVFTAQATVGAPAVIAARSLTAQAAPINTAVASPPSVRVTDAFGNPVGGAAVTFTVASGGGSTQPASPAVVTTGADGVASLTAWTLGPAIGPNTVTATATGLSGSPVTFTGTGEVGAATTIAITTQPAGAVSGSVLTTAPVVQLRDANGNLVTSSTATVEARIASGSGTLVGTTLVSASGGIATFPNLRINGGGAHTLVFTSPGLTSATSAVFTVTQVPTSLAIQAQPSTGTTASALTPAITVRVLDGAGVAITTGTGATLDLTASLASGPGVLSGTTAATAVNGVATFGNLVITGVGVHTLRFASSTPALSVTSANVLVNPGPPAVIAATTATSQSVIAGSAVPAAPGVKVTDAFGNAVSGVSVTFRVTAGGGSITPASPATVVTDAAGLASLSTWTTGTVVGTNTVTASTVSPLTGNPVAFTATGTVGPPTQLVLTTAPASASSGSPVTPQPVVSIRDANGNTVTTSNAVVSVARGAGTGTLSGPSSATAANGVATFSGVIITGVGAHTLVFSSPGLPSVTSPSFTVTPPPATQLVIGTQPDGAVSGSALSTQPVLQLRDAFGTVVAGNTAPVSVTITSGNGTLVGTQTVNAVDGVARFTNLRVDGGGAHQLTFTSPGLPNAVSATFNVLQSAFSLSVSQQPGGAVSGQPFTTPATVQILDRAGKVVSFGADAALAVTVSRASGTGSLAGALTRSATAGVVTFSDLSITGSGAHTLQFATAVPALTTTSASFVVGPPPATQLAIRTQPAGAVSGNNFTTQPVVEIRDAFGALVTTSTATVTATITTGTGTLVGTTAVNAVGGVATFTNLRINGGGNFVLTFSSPPLTSVASASFVVTQVPASLVVITPPSGAVSGTALTQQPVIEIRDQGGVRVTTGTGATLTITASVAPIGTPAATLSGPVALTAANGRAAFTGLVLTGSGSITLRFSTTTPTLSIDAPAITVTPP